MMTQISQPTIIESNLDSKSLDFAANSVSKDSKNLLDSIKILVEKSFFDIIKDSINLEPTPTRKFVKRGYSAQIDMTFSDKVVLKSCLVFNKVFLKIVCNDLLFDENPNLATIVDMSKELANLTIGHAKVLAQKENITFKISTPYFSVSKDSKIPDISYKLLQNGYCNIYIFE